MISIDVLGFLLIVHSGMKVNHATDRETCVVDHFEGKYQRSWRMGVNAERSGRYIDHLKVFSPQFESYKGPVTEGTTIPVLNLIRPQSVLFI